MSDFLDGAGPRITLVRGGVSAGICVEPAIEAGRVGNGRGVILVIGPAHPAERAAHDEATRSIAARLSPVRPVRIAVSRIGYLGNNLVGRGVAFRLELAPGSGVAAIMRDVFVFDAFYRPGVTRVVAGLD